MAEKVRDERARGDGRVMVEREMADGAEQGVTAWVMAEKERG